MITGLELVQKLYSEGYYIEEQKEFGIKDWGKSISKGIENWRVNRLKKSITKTKISKEKIDNKIKDLDSKAIQNPKLERAIQREAINENAAVIGFNNNSTNLLTDPDIKTHTLYDLSTNQNIPKRDKKKLYNLLKNRDYQINYDRSKGGPASLAHEVGHIKTMNDPGEAGKISRDVNTRVRDKVLKNDNSIHKGQDKRNWDNNTIEERKLESKQLVENEKDASKRGLKLMKEKGASKKEIKHAEKTLKLARKSYKKQGDIYVKTAKLKKIRPNESLD